MCCDTLFAQKICLKGILKIPRPALVDSGCFFASILSRLERGPDPLVLTPVSDVCELASEPVALNWFFNLYALNRFFNSRYFSSANSNKNLWQNKDQLEDKGRIELFARRFRAVFEFLCWSGSRYRHDQETTWLWTRPELLFSRFRSFFKRAAPRHPGLLSNPAARQPHAPYPKTPPSPFMTSFNHSIIFVSVLLELLCANLPTPIALHSSFSKYHSFFCLRFPRNSLLR